MKIRGYELFSRLIKNYFNHQVVLLIGELLMAPTRFVQTVAESEAFANCPRTLAAQYDAGFMANGDHHAASLIVGLGLYHRFAVQGIASLSISQASFTMV
jgi:hypothetical protein